MIHSGRGIHDKFGHYSVNNKIFLHKQDAIREAKFKTENIRFNYNDEWFDCFDWKTEPEPSVPLSEFYRRRAQFLRDKYDYLILMYSGGPDSKNMLDIYTDNNIRIDEIVNINSYERTGVSEGTINNADYVYNVKPVLDELQKRDGFDTKITIIDEVDFVKKNWQFYQRTGDVEIMHGSMQAPNNWFTKGNWVRYVPHIWDKMINGVRVGVVMATDKTPLRLKDGKYYTDFVDLFCVDTALAFENDQDLRHIEFLEYFYHSPECVDLIIKQAHCLKNFVEHNRGSDMYEDPKVYENAKTRVPHHCYSKHVNGNLKYGPYHKILYPNWNPCVVTPKEIHMIFRPRDSWFINQFTNEERKFWMYGVHQTIKDFKNIVHSNNGLTGFKVLNSKPRFLE